MLNKYFSLIRSIELRVPAKFQILLNVYSAFYRKQTFKNSIQNSERVPMSIFKSKYGWVLFDCTYWYTPHSSNTRYT